jgi:LysR family transcriptional regulator, glycine cleavage system transcriptional activator
MRLLPGTRSLRTLLAAGKHLNFTRAADELGLTPAAVSFQIKEIEDQLGLKLFERTSRSIRLTNSGAIMYEAAADALDIMHRAVTRSHKATRGTAQLKVTADPQFATKWLMRRVERFRALHPDIELRFDIANEVRNFELDDIDVAIRFGAGKYPNLTTNQLFNNVIVPVCSPRLLTSGNPLKVPRDLLRHTLVHIEWARQGVTWPNWRMWMAAAGVQDFDDSNTIVFSTSTEAIDAAIAGDAVALADFAMVANDLSEGRLVQPFDLSISLPAKYAYFLVYPDAFASDRRIVAFRDWILNEAAGADT